MNHCIKCGAEYATPVALCRGDAKVETMVEGEPLMVSRPCGSTAWRITPDVVEAAPVPKPALVSLHEVTEATALDNQAAKAPVLKK